MPNLFTKAAVFGDLHLGKRSDSPVHNQDCLDYIAWFCAQAKKHKVDKILFLGDWFDNRSRLRLDTIDSGTTAMRMLTDVAPVVMLVGNHDMFFKNNRSVHSVSAFKEWEHVTVVDECTVIDNVGLCPFLVGTEYLEVSDMKAKYVFGHFELPRFLMNSTIEMQDHGGLNSDHFDGIIDMVFSGHFHKRQLKTNRNKVPVWYIGSPFGTDFNDVDDVQRGMMILEWGGEPKFIDYQDGPLFQRFKVSEIAEMIDAGTVEASTRPTSVLEVKDDLGLELEDISMIRDELNKYVREARVIQGRTTPGMDLSVDVADIDDKSIEQVVIEHLLEIDPRGSDIEPATLVSLFRGK